MTSHAALLVAIEELVRSAGEAVMAIYQRDFEVYQKADKSPLTEADLLAHDIIRRGLRELSADPILSEEDKHIPWQQRQAWSRYWLVDPIDGTKEFIRKSDEFTLNIALIERGIPIVSVVYAPALGVLYTAAKGMGAWKQDQHSRRALKLTQTAQQAPLRALISRSHSSRESAVLTAVYPAIEFIEKGSSLKLCAVADGQADLYLRLGPTSEWDTAAAQCIVESAGGQVLSAELQALKYNQKESVLNPAFIVSRCVQAEYALLFQN